MTQCITRRQFNRAVAGLSAAAVLAPFGIVRAQASALKVGVLLPRSGFQGFIGQSCQKGADLAPGVIKEMLGVNIELMNADTETNIDTARTRAERLIQEGATSWSARSTPAPPRRSRRSPSSAASRSSSTSPPRRRSPSRATVRVPQLPDRRRHRAQRPRPDQRHVPGDQHGAAHRGVHARQRHVRPGDGEGHRRGAAAAHAAAVQGRGHDLLRPGGEGPHGRGREGQGDEGGFPAARLPAQRRDHPAPRDGQAALVPDGRDQPGLAGDVRGAVLQDARQALGALRLQCALVQPAGPADRGGREGVPEAEPQGPAAVPRPQRRLHVRGDPDRGRRLQARENRPNRRCSSTPSGRPTSRAR